MTTMNNLTNEQINQKFLKRDIIQRSIEFFVAEVIISLIIAFLVNMKIIPSNGRGLLVLGAGVLVYLFIITRNCFEYFWIVNDRRTYFISSILSYAPVIVIGLALSFISTKIYSWAFLPYKFLMLLRIGKIPSNLLIHLVVFIIIAFIGLFFIPTPQTDEWDED